MQFHKIAEGRKSVREFKEGKMEQQEISKLLAFCNTIVPLNKELKSSFHFIESGDEVYQYLMGNTGYHGMSIRAPHYLLFLSEEGKSHLKNAGFMMEQALLEAFRKGLGSCWIDIRETPKGLKEKLGIQEQGEILALAALGYPKSNILGIETSFSYRDSIENLVYLERWNEFISIEELQQRGLKEIFYYVRHAPSWGNIQPWKFILDRDKLILTILKENPYIDEKSTNNHHELDCGIIMLYVEKMMHEKGIGGHWNLDVEALNHQRTKYNIPENRMIMGWYPL